jgi:hypothetical protein
MEVPMKTRKRQRGQTVKGSAGSSPRRIALLIGNARVRNSEGKGYALDLPGIDKDLSGLGGVLGDPEYGGFEIVSLMGPTLIEVRREIARVAGGLRSEDMLLIYYTGTSTVGLDHQLYLPVSDSDVNFLEATCLDSEYVLSVLRRCDSRHQVLLIDGCHSGAFFVNNRGIPDGFCAITSCGPKEFSYGDADGGFFTRLLLEGLRGATADADGDGVVTTDELFRYVLPRAQAQSNPATPQMWSWNLPEPIPLVHVRQRVFVSYRRADAAVADGLLKRLESAGYGVWLDRSDIGGGSRWREEIEQALQQADTVIFLISQPALESDEVYRELARAIELGKTIVPLRLDQAPLYGWFKEKLGAIQHIEYDTHDPAEKWWGKLLAALRHARRMPHRKEEPAKAEPEPPEPSPPQTRRKRRVP